MMYPVRIVNEAYGPMVLRMDVMDRIRDASNSSVISVCFNAIGPSSSRGVSTSSRHFQFHVSFSYCVWYVSKFWITSLRH